MESLVLILEVITYELREEKGAVLLQGKGIESIRDERRGGMKPYGSSRIRSYTEVTNPTSF